MRSSRRSTDAPSSHAAGLRHDEAMLVARFAKHAAQRGNRLVEVVLLDNDVRPDCVEQRLLLEQLTTVLDENAPKSVQAGEDDSTPP